MNILVCVKQVPDTTEIKIDPVKNTLIRDGVPSILNPFDGYALEAAARIKDKDPDTKIVAVTMGPPQAVAVLKECLAIAADKAYLVSGRTFGGSDTLATSYILSQAIGKIEETEGKFDAIFCGKQAIDGDTAQVGPEIAEHLGYPQVTYGLEAEVDGDTLKVTKEMEDGKAVIGIKFPCVITYTKPAWDPRYPTIKRKMAANRAEIPTLDDTMFPEMDTTRIGLKGSPTHVKKTFVPQKKTGGVKIQEADNETSAKKLFELLSGASII
ncbi:electron transfer flavoprotein subunit beta/FixA family protein [Vermiculatibacterium agrestimuris]|uniref:electron transfer flavoprotein subunit beta/FixA family protein n=1 Tax=Vermiculatibacterium agrestimuris TaxID=2941519 RepID=UPI00203F4BCD|nr:electron transfer flavoprotein subunit beta/FixA family protein [Vermiculatibacterium agrestimuris]